MIEMYLIDVVLCSVCFGTLDGLQRRLGESGEYIPLKGVSKWIASGRYRW
jgi:hypothetical protein